MKQHNLTVNGLWIGSRLSVLELLTIKSFLAHGHRFQLWLYQEMETELPEGVQVMDANSIIPSEKIFRYKNTDQFGHGKGSVSGFSDVFRYKLLYDHGGWWVDMDVTCLLPLDTEHPYYFRPHHELLLVGNVMKCPKNSQLMRKCFEEADGEIDADNTDWHRPIAILADNVRLLNLERYILRDRSLYDLWNEVGQYIYTTRSAEKEWYFIHWMNEEWRSRGLAKDDFMFSSEYGRLLTKYGLVKNERSLVKRIKNRIRFFLKQHFP